MSLSLQVSPQVPPVKDSPTLKLHTTSPLPTPPPSPPVTRQSPSSSRQETTPPRKMKVGALSAEDYHQYENPIDHILNVPDVYIGSDEHVKRNSWICNYQDPSGPKMICQEISLPEGLERLFLEILSNGGDNADRANRAGADPGMIEVIMDKTTISIKNGGPPIPVEMHPTSGTWVPDMIFGRLHSSSNYDKNVVRMGIGKNGLGAKLSNIYSKQFLIIIGDPTRKLRYTQVWNNNMRLRGEPQIEPYTGESFVQVVYNLDFPRFKYTEYPDEALYLFARHTADVSFTCKVPCTFNGVKLHVQNIKDYAVLFFGEEISKTGIIHREWPPGTEVTVKKGVHVPTDEKVAPMVEMCVLDTPDAGMSIAFVNGMMTPDGGVHVDACSKSLAGPLVEMINGVGRGKKDKDKGKDAPKPIKLTQADVKPHVSMIINTRLPDPKFKGQTKTMLASPTPRIEIDEQTLRPVMKWQLVERLYAALEAKMFKTLSKTDGKKRRHIKLKKGIDANDAGGPKSMDCTLMIVEGNSAMGYAETLIGCINNGEVTGRDLFGICPIKGKLINTRKADFEQIMNNQEIAQIKQMMGFREGVDYRLEENLRTLRYRFILIMTDADNDGNHIKGLILNMLDCRFPTYLAGTNVLFYHTPYLRVWKGKNIHKFYTTAEYEAWKHSNSDWSSYESKYYKGLATSEDPEIEDDYKTQRLVYCIYDDRTPDALSLAFDEKRVKDRKDWLSKWKTALDIEYMQEQPISHFIHHEFVQYSLVNTQQSIPSLLDGLKESLRKILWGAILQWGSTDDAKSLLKKTLKPEKVAQFGAFVARETDYHYGEANLYGTIVRMAQHYVGANNLSYFQPKGQFGSRETGEPQGAARYIYTAPEWWIPYVYRKEDIPLLQYREDEGKKIEPYYLLPIIPIVLVNGTIGIGTGHSTYIPSHNPLDIIAWLKAKINNTSLPELVPWYRGFTGTIQLKTKLIKHDEEDKSEEENEALPNETTTVEEDVPAPVLTINKAPEGKYASKTSVITTGEFTVLPNGTVVVTELPIRRWTVPYRQWLDSLVESRTITDYRDAGNKDIIRFEIRGLAYPTHDTLKLRKSFGMTNMVLLNSELRPVKYNTVKDILEEYYVQRLPFYEARRLNIISTIDEEIKTSDTKARFIQAIVVDKTLVVMNRPKKDIYAEMERMNFPKELLTRSSVANLSIDDITELRQYITELQQKREVYVRTTAQQLWLADLVEFENAYNEYYR